MTPKERKAFEKQLLDLQVELEKDLQDSKTGSEPVKLDQQAVGRVSRIDAIQQQQMQLAAVKRIKMRILQVNAALERVNDEDFGLCVVCEEPISLKRMKARPESTQCIKCANKK